MFVISMAILFTFWPLIAWEKHQNFPKYVHLSFVEGKVLINAQESDKPKRP